MWAIGCKWRKGIPDKQHNLPAGGEGIEDFFKKPEDGKERRKLLCIIMYYIYYNNAYYMHYYCWG